MGENNIVKLVEAFNQKGNSNIPIFHAEVVSVRPLVLTINNQSIQKNLYTNPSFFVWEGKGIEEINKIFPVLPENSLMEKFLRDFFERWLLQPGDEVVALQESTSFYILEKVIKA